MTAEILETMTYAVPMALKNHKIMYVFNLDGDWGYSGKLPRHCYVFYIIYPNGSMDRSHTAPDISLAELEAYQKKHEKERHEKDESNEKDTFSLLCFCAAFILSFGLYNLKLDKDGRFMGLKLYQQHVLFAVLATICACPVIQAKESLCSCLSQYDWFRRAYASNCMLMAIITIICSEHMDASNSNGIFNRLRHSSFINLGQ